MKYRNRFLLVPAALAVLALGAWTAPAQGRDRDRADDRDRHRPDKAFVVTCTTTIAWDVGPCYGLAKARCDAGEPQLLGALASTQIGTTRQYHLYQTMVRYRCSG